MLLKIVVGVLCRVLILTGTFPLHLKNVQIPTYKFRGESALLECEYELAPGSQPGNHHHRSRNHFGSSHGVGGGSSTRDRAYDIYSDDDYFGDHSNHGDYNGRRRYGGEGEKLYSVKWYKDNEEFYRYVPSANPQIKHYKVDGIRLDPNQSDNTKVFLRNLSLKSSGVYRCEISAEAPNFDSVQGEGRMDVIYIPKDGPHISGDAEHRSYHMGETLELNCTSGRSYPASTLQWYINEQLVMNPSLLVPYPLFQNPHGLITSYLGLSVVVGPHHYDDKGVMRVKCVASLSPTLWWEGKESVLQWKPPSSTIDHRYAMLLVRSSSQRIFYSSSLVLSTVALVVLLSL